MDKRIGFIKKRRGGAVLVEFALVLPVILLTFAGIIEISRVLMLQHTADTAAYEGARNAMVPGASASDATTSATLLLTAAGLRASTVTVTPTDINEQTPVLTVLVSIPVKENSWISPMFFVNYNVQSEVTLFCERPPVVQLVGIPELKLKSAKGKKSDGET